jgi:hypothetical protein
MGTKQIIISLVFMLVAHINIEVPELIHTSDNPLAGTENLHNINNCTLRNDFCKKHCTFEDDFSVIHTINHCIW